MRFKSWEDFNNFLLEYGRCTCLNCFYGGSGDLNSQYVFCTHHITMVNLYSQKCCGEWHSIDNGKSLEDYRDETLLKISDEVITILEESDKEWTIEEVQEVINEHEKDIS